MSVKLWGQIEPFRERTILLQHCARSPFHRVSHRLLEKGPISLPFRESFLSTSSFFPFSSADSLDASLSRLMSRATSFDLKARFLNGSTFEKQRVKTVSKTANACRKIQENSSRAYINILRGLNCFRKTIKSRAYLFRILFVRCCTTIFLIELKQNSRKK